MILITDSSDFNALHLICKHTMTIKMNVFFYVSKIIKQNNFHTKEYKVIIKRPILSSESELNTAKQTKFSFQKKCCSS